MARGVAWTMLAAAAVCGAGFALAGVELCESALRAPRRPVPAAPFVDDTAIHWRNVETAALDGVPLRAWLLWPDKSNDSAVIVLHGIADSRTGELGLARMFLKNGYQVLAPDNRAQGESGGELVTYGVREADDVHRWVTWLVNNRHPRHIFALGESLGAAVLLQSLAMEPRFDAVVAESSFANFQWIAQDRVAQMIPRLLARPAVWMGLRYARWRYGLDFRAASPEAAVERTHTPVLLIHGLADDKTPPAHSEVMAASNPAYARLWLVPGAGHTGAFGTAPREFAERVLGWFASYQNFPPGIQPREM